MYVTVRRLLALRPVSNRHKTPYAQSPNPLLFGLIAEQVAREFPPLIQRGPDGKPAGVYYQQLPVLLLAQLRRQQREIDTLQAQNRRLHHQQRQIQWLIRQARHR